jgi:hypothetical protein
LCLTTAIALPGCLAIYSPRTITVSVHDGETAAPIPSAKVLLSYRWFLTFNVPPSVDAPTNDRGIATIKGTTFEPQHWTVSAPGYITFEHGAAPRGKHPALDIPLFRSPEPALKITIPKDYTGPLFLDFVPAPNLTFPVGQRLFPFRPNARGYIRIDTPLLLSRVDPARAMTVQDEDGTPVSDTLLDYVHPAKRAVHLVDAFSNYSLHLRRYIFLIGTRTEAEALERSLQKPAPSGGTMQNEPAFNALFTTAATPPPP